MIMLCLLCNYIIYIVLYTVVLYAHNIMIRVITDAHCVIQHGTTALIKAGVQGHATVVESLLQQGADVHTQNRVRTPLFYAGILCEYIYIYILLMCIIVIQDGYTALMHACRKGYAAVVEVLLQHGASSDAHTNV